MANHKRVGEIAIATLATAITSVSPTHAKEKSSPDKDFAKSVREAISCVLHASGSIFRPSTLDRLPPPSGFFEDIEDIKLPNDGTRREVEFDANDTTYTVLVNGDSIQVYVRPKGTLDRAKVLTAYDENSDGYVDIGTTLDSDASEYIAGGFDDDDENNAKKIWERFFRNEQMERHEKPMTPEAWESKWKGLREAGIRGRQKYTTLYRGAIEATLAHCRANLQPRKK